MSARNEKILDLWQAGRSGGEIKAALGLASRNIVLGVVYRTREHHPDDKRAALRSPRPVRRSPAPRCPGHRGVTLPRLTFLEKPL